MRLGHGRRPADNGIVRVKLHRDDELRIAAALLGIDAPVGLEGIILRTAEFDRSICLAAADRDLIAADICQSSGSTGPVEFIGRVNAVFQAGGVVHCACAFVRVIFPLGDFVRFFIVLEFFLGAAGLAGIIFFLFSGLDRGSVLYLLRTVAVEYDPLAITPRLR